MTAIVKPFNTAVMNEYEGVLVVTTRTPVRVRSANYTGAHKLIAAGQAQAIGETVTVSSIARDLVLVKDGSE